MKKVNLSTILFVGMFIASCTAKYETLESKASPKSLSETSVDSPKDVRLDEPIMPIEGSRDTLKRPPMMEMGSYDTKEDIDQLDGVPIYLKVRGNSSSKQFINATNRGAEITVADYSGNINQQFRIKTLPATSGIPYLIYSNITGTPIRIGTYRSRPDIKILYASQEETESLFGASWAFKKAQYSTKSFVIENQDYPQQGGSWWDVYYSVITVNNDRISFSKYQNSPRQEFEIVPVETFKIEEIKFNIDASAVLSKFPDLVFSDGYSNNGPIEQNHSFTIAETYKETSTFNRKTSYNVNASTEIKTKVPFVASGKITVSASFGQEFTYGTGEEKTLGISRTYPVVVPANHRAELTLTLLKYRMNVEYVAVCRGLTSGKRINITGRWEGVDFVESDAVLEVFPINGAAAAHTRAVITKDMLKAQTPIKLIK